MQKALTPEAWATLSSQHSERWLRVADWHFVREGFADRTNLTLDDIADVILLTEESLPEWVR